MTNLPPAPAELKWLADAIGFDLMLQLIEALGGTRLYIPARPTEDSPIAKRIGLDAARRLGAVRGTEEIALPLCKWWRVRVYTAMGLGTKEIALKLGATERTVRRLLHPETSDQLQLTL